MKITEIRIRQIICRQRLIPAAKLELSGLRKIDRQLRPGRVDESRFAVSSSFARKWALSWSKPTAGHSRQDRNMLHSRAAASGTVALPASGILPSPVCRRGVAHPRRTCCQEMPEAAVRIAARATTSTAFSSFAFLHSSPLAGLPTQTRRRRSHSVRAGALSIQLPSAFWSRGRGEHLRGLRRLAVGKSIVCARETWSDVFV